MFGSARQFLHVAECNSAIQQIENLRYSLHHLRHFLDDGGGEFDEGADDPWQQQQQHADDGQCFRHEGERLFVDGGHRLEQADGEADDHGDDENGRGDGERLVDHRLEKFDGEFRIHQKVES